MPKNKGKGKANAQDSKAEAVRDGVNERQSTRDGGQGTGERGQGALEGTGQGQISPRKQPLSDDGPAVGQEATTVESDETHAGASVFKVLNPHF